MLNPYTVAGTLAVIVGLAGCWRSWLRAAREDTGVMDQAMLRAGHAPPETEPERTNVLRPIERDDDLDYGRHSTGSMHQRSSLYRGEHHQRIGCLKASVLLARESVHA